MKEKKYFTKNNEKNVKIFKKKEKIEEKSIINNTKDKITKKGAKIKETFNIIYYNNFLK